MFRFHCWSSTISTLKVDYKNTLRQSLLPSSTRTITHKMAQDPEQVFTGIRRTVIRSPILRDSVRRQYKLSATLSRLAYHRGAYISPTCPEQGVNGHLILTAGRKLAYHKTITFSKVHQYIRLSSRASLECFMCGMKPFIVLWLSGGIWMFSPHESNTNAQLIIIIIN